jgi:steroid Delta-isomerase
MSIIFNIDTAASQIQHGFEGLTPGGVNALALLYAVDARFKDPFNDVQGRGEIAHIFSHMFSQVDAPKFAVTALIVKEGVKDEAKGVCPQIFMRWDFSFVARGGAQTIHGATHFELNADGLITLHRDYWDAAEELYEKIPVLGSILRWLKTKLKA